MGTARYRDRRHAGCVLAASLAEYAARDLIVLALPRGGVPVAYEVATRLGALLDVYLVRKLGIPGHDEYAMGAIASDEVHVFDEELIARLDIPRNEVAAVMVREVKELRRREVAYRGIRPRPVLTGKTVILVDDGLATGWTMRAALEGLRQAQPAEIVVAVPVASGDACRELAREADAVICATTPEPFGAVGEWYADFSDTTDDDVKILLSARERERRALQASSQAASAL